MLVLWPRLRQNGSRDEARSKERAADGGKCGAQWFRPGRHSGSEEKQDLGSFLDSECFEGYWIQELKFGESHFEGRDSSL